MGLVRLELVVVASNIRNKLLLLILLGNVSSTCVTNQDHEAASQQNSDGME